MRSAGSSTNWSSSLFLFLGVLYLDYALELLGQDHDGVIGERLGDGDHLPQLEQGLDELAGADLERFAQVFDARAALDLDRGLRAGRRLLLQGRLVGLAQGAVAAVTRAAFAALAAA